ncbi:MAG: MATE family efflux transporter [Bacteroidales bacterium]|nr:MATE family efflux transporter [Bacteroidales bacterium]
MLHKNIEALEKGSIKRLLWRFFLPSFAGVILNSLYNIVDRIFIGQGVGALALSGVSAVFPVMLILMGFGMLIGIGAGVRLSITLGKKDFAMAEKVLGNAFVLIIIVSVFLTFLGFAIKGPLLQLFGVSSETFAYANSYLNIILPGTIFGTMGFSLNNIIRSEGNAKVAMYSMLISAGLNLLLDPLFIFVFDMGVKGAAWATVISQMALAVWVILHFTGKKAVIRLKPAKFRLEGEIIWYIITVGFAPFSMQIAASFVQGTFNTQLIKFGGDLAIGAMGIINSYAMLVLMSIIAVNMASQPIVGFNFGAKNFLRVKQTLKICLFAGSVISISGFLFAQVFPGLIVKLFNISNNELIDTGIQGLRIFMAAWPVVGFQIIASNYFQSTGKAGMAVFLSLLRQVLVLIPVLLILPDYIGLKGVWLSGPVSDMIAGIVCLWLLAREIKRLEYSVKTENIIPRE